MNEFEQLLGEYFTPLQRYVNYKISKRQDAEDILQEVCLTAAEKFDTLQDKTAFKAWLIGIAAHKCTDYYRKHAGEKHLSLDMLPDSMLRTGRSGIAVHNAVHDTLDSLEDRDRQILYLYFFRELPQKEIARQLSVPIGTVKSRLYYAKEKFKEQYPYKQTAKGESIMKKLPEILPEYQIEASDLAPFSVKCEELMGFCIIPRLNEKVTWGSYDIPSRKINDITNAVVTGKAEIHGIEGVEIIVKQHDCMSSETTERYFVAQLTETHSRYLAESHMDHGIRKTFTFLDSDVFMNNWGFGEDNCGYPIDIVQNGTIHRTGNDIQVSGTEETVDIVGRYQVTINGKTYDTVCVMVIGHFSHRIAIEQYLDKNGRTVLWRRFNKNDWAFSRYGKQWTELLPENERLTVNGETYVHWYDCITDYIL